MYGFVAFLQRHLKIKQITGEKMGFSDWHYVFQKTGKAQSPLIQVDELNNLRFC